MAISISCKPVDPSPPPRGVPTAGACSSDSAGPASSWLVLLVLLPFLASVTHAADDQRHELASPQAHVDIVGDVEGNFPAARKAAPDTIWFATWDFEGCDDTGWVRSDFRIQNDGNVYWTTSNDHDGIGAISGEAAVLTHHDLCWVIPDGYDNNWYQGIRIEYTGDSKLIIDYLIDSEAGFDLLRVETDPGCASYAQVDYDVDPVGESAGYRHLVWTTSGFDTTTATTDTLTLNGYDTGDTHCVYIAFRSDGGIATSDTPGFGEVLGAAAVVDNIRLFDANDQIVLFEDFTGFTPGPFVDFVNMYDSEPFGSWSRVFPGISDNDLCTENPTCAWLATDDTTPTLANVPWMAFGPDSYVIKNWLDDAVIGPWVSLANTPDAISTIIQFRRFPGNHFTTSRIVQNWSIRGRSKISNTDTPAPGDSVHCVSRWGHAFNWDSLSLFRWVTSSWDATSDFPAGSREIQVRMRTSDWQLIAGGPPPPIPFEPGPGPYWDRIRLGRQIITGPVINEGIDARTQAQDAAPNDPAVAAGPMYAQAANGDIFGTTAFSRSGDLGTHGLSANLIVGDSITVIFTDVLGHGGLSVELHATIVEGPHTGKAPAPYTVGANGFFVVPADSARTASGNLVADRYFVDLDDTYFRGGDTMKYFWWATDAQGGATSLPEGLTALPVDADEAETSTGGLFEVNYLPRINWSVDYLIRIAGDPHGDLDPTPQELENSSQDNCILYVQNVNARRRSGNLNRSSFMYTLDKLGLRGQYDVYDLMGLGNTNNQLGARMSPEQAAGYALIVYDSGDRTPGAPILPDGTDLDAEKIDMDTWFRTWNAISGAPNMEHTLWFIGSNIMQEKPASPLLTGDMAVTFVAADQAQDDNPDVFGVANASNHLPCEHNFLGNHFALDGGCPDSPDYDDITANGTGVVTYRYGKGTPGTPGAMVMNAHASGFTTVLQSFPWSDIAASIGQAPTQSDADLVARVLNCAWPVPCISIDGFVDAGPDANTPPARTALRQNTPNPFNPVTTIHFDLARDAHVSLRIYDVAGRLVRTLKNETMTAGFDRQVRWNGLDDRCARVASGVYLYRLVAGDVTATRKLVVMK